MEAFSQELIEKGMRNLGLGQGDSVIVHSSLKDVASIKELRAAPDHAQGWFIDAFKNVVGSDGLVIFPTFSKTFSANKHGPSGLVWDKHETPSRVGSITDYAWRQNNWERSDHPTHSVTAFGNDAAEFCKGHRYDEDSTFGRATPWGGLWRRDAWVCMYGTWFNTCTAIHLSEDWLDLPYMAPACAVLVKDENGEPKEVNVTKSPHGSRDFYGRKDTKVEKRILADLGGDVIRGQIGKAAVVLINFRKLISCVCEAHYDDPCLLLSDNPEDKFTEKYRQPTIDRMAKRTRGDWQEGLE